MGDQIREVIVVLHAGKAGAKEVRSELEGIFRRRHVKARWLKTNHADALTDIREIKSCGKAQMIIACGGDGTLLQAARMTLCGDLPILGINLGTLGFLSTIPREKIAKAIPEVLDGNYLISERLALDYEVVRRNRTIARGWAMNDVVVARGNHSHMIRLWLRISDAHATAYYCDGLIFATATGSTAYSLSAGGPIVSPLVPAFAITPICAHSLTDRPLVVSSVERPVVSIPVQSPSMVLQADGMMCSRLKPGDHVAIQASRKPTRLVHLPENDFYRVVNEKLKWSGTSI